MRPQTLLWKEPALSNNCADGAAGVGSSLVMEVGSWLPAVGATSSLVMEVTGYRLWVQLVHW